MTEETQPNAGGNLPNPTPETPAAPPPPETGALAQTPAAPSSVVRVEGLAETLADVRHELHLITHATRYEWVNKRLILLRNAIIALAIMAATVVIVVGLFREAYRQTLTIAAFEVPERLAERGITGEVVAKHLFDELIKRRKTITTLEAGELKSAWSERHSDVVGPDAKFTLQSVFRYLRHLTGREIVIDGEMLLDGDDVTLLARVAGNPPRSVKGKLADWDRLLGNLANYVFETTQPVVLAGYLGVTATTPEDLTTLSQLIQRMVDAEPPATDSALAVAYHAYGEALNRQRRPAEALVAWERSRTYDPKFVLPYWSAAIELFGNDPAASEQLFRQAQALESSDSAKLRALGRRFFLALNKYDCLPMKEALDEAARIVKDRKFTLERQNASFLQYCEYQQARAIGMMRSLAAMHPENALYWNSLGAALTDRPGGKYLGEARAAYSKGVAADPNKRSVSVRMNLALVSAMLGDHDAAAAWYVAGVELRREDAPYPRHVLARMHYARGDYKEAEQLLRLNVADKVNASAQDYPFLGQVLEAQGKIDEAVEILRSGYARFPLYCPNYDTAGRVLLKAGREKEAFAEWESGIRAIPKCDVNYVHSARALIERKRLPEARQKLDQLLKVSPQSDGAVEAKELLAALAKAG